MRRVGMRIVKSVTSVTWIPSEAIEGMPKLPFELGITHYDDPPPDRIDERDLEALRAAGRIRQANQLRAWIEVDGGTILDCGYSGKAHLGSTSVKLGPKMLAFADVKYPLIQNEPERGPDWVKFVQSAGGRMGVPAPRRVRGKPFPQIPSAAPRTPARKALPPDRLGLGLDDAPADHLRRRDGEVHVGRSEPVPAPLDLRQRGQARREERHRGFRALVARVVRAAHALGRRGFAGCARGGGFGARTGAVPTGDDPARGARAASAQCGRDAGRAGPAWDGALPRPRRHAGRRGGRGHRGRGRARRDPRRACLARGWASVGDAACRDPLSRGRNPRGATRPVRAGRDRVGAASGEDKTY